MNYAELFARLGIEPGSIRQDANETAFLTRQIEYVRARVYEKKYTNLLARRFIPQATDIPPWADTVVSVMYDQFGSAKIVPTNGASDDFPRSDVTVSEGNYKVASLGASYGFNQMELRQAAALGVPLSEKRAGAARRSIEAAIDELLFKGTLTVAGQTTTGFTGIANHGSVPLLTSNSTGLSWQGATSAMMMKDLNDLITVPEQTTNQIYRPNRVLLPAREYDWAATRYFNDFQTLTVLNAFLQNNPGVTVEKWFRLDGAGASSSNRLISYYADPEVLESVIPLDFEQFAPQERNLALIVNCHARCGGVLVHHPKAMAYMDLDASSS